MLKFFLSDRTEGLSKAIHVSASKVPWMLADLDYLVELPNGKIAILECKTTNPFGKENWWYNGCEIVPLNYEVQGVTICP